MGITITINAVSGVSPYNVYICQVDGTGCFYIDQTSTIPFTFDIPTPYNLSTEYMVKIIDAEGCSITNTGSL